MACANDYAFGSISGSTFAFYFFLAISLVIGIGTYTLLVHPEIRNILFHEWSPRIARVVSLGFSAFLGLAVFLAVYFTSLDGFYRMRLREGGLQVDYILPKRTLTFAKGSIAEAQREPTFKQRWRLVLYTPSGQRFESTNASYSDVKKAWECLRLELHPRN